MRGQSNRVRDASGDGLLRAEQSQTIQQTTQFHHKGNVFMRTRIFIKQLSR